MFPRNPKLKHWYLPDSAKEAHERGDTHMTAMCGDTMEVPSNYKSRSKRADTDGLVSPKRVDWDTEFEDPDTGMWWVDMDCPNCLRLVNEDRVESERERLEYLLAWFAKHPEKIADNDMWELSEHLERLAEPHYSK